MEKLEGITQVFGHMKETSKEEKEEKEEIL